MKLLALIAFLWLSLAWAWPLDAVHPDSTRDLLMARDCWERGLCVTSGPQSSAVGLHQGALWLDLLALFRRLGATPLAVGLGRALAQAAAIAVFARHTARPVAAPLLLIAAVLAAPVVIWAPTLQLPLALAATALGLRWLQRPAPALTLLTGALFGLTVDAHLAGWPLLLSFCALALQAGALRQTVALFASAVAVTLTLSPQTWQEAARLLLAQPRLWVWALALPALLAMARLTVRLGAAPQVALVGLFACALLGRAHQFELRYLVPWLGALALTASALLQRPRWLLAAAWLGALGLVAVHGGLRPTTTYTAVAALARDVARAGIGWPDILWRLRGPHAGPLAEATAVYLPAGRGAPGELVLAPAPLAVGSEPSWQLQPSRVAPKATEVCSQAATERACRPLRLVFGDVHPASPFADRAWPHVLPLTPGAEWVSLRLPLRPGPPTAFSIARDATDHGCDWRFAGQAEMLVAPSTAADMLLTCRVDPATARLPDLARLLPALNERALVPFEAPEKQPGGEGAPHPVGEKSNDFDAPESSGPAEVTPPAAVPPVVSAPAVLRPDAGPKFAHVAALLAVAATESGEPDIAVTATGATITWPDRGAVVLTRSAAPPYFAVVAAPSAAARAGRVRAALARVFTTDPWRVPRPPPPPIPDHARPFGVAAGLALLGLAAFLLALWRTCDTPATPLPQ